MDVFSTVADIRQHRSATAGTVALVPTMGALHEGHLTLMREAAKHVDEVWVSIFVNPTQFGPHEDFDRYPRTLKADLANCEAAGVSTVFVPTVDEMYPPDAIDTQILVPDLAGVLEGKMRPGHFDGVCRVVAKLLNVTQPTVACFGQKDYQQLKIIEAMVRDLMMPIEIVGVPTVRESDGLAMSSRNRYLNDEQRKHALGISKALKHAKMLIEASGETDPTVIAHAMQQVLEAHHLDVEYAQVRHPQTLAQLDCIEPALTGGVVALIAARIEAVRLIDNMIIGA